jgi:hypothetical protein
LQARRGIAYKRQERYRHERQARVKRIANHQPLLARRGVGKVRRQNLQRARQRRHGGDNPNPQVVRAEESRQADLERA